MARIDSYLGKLAGDEVTPKPPVSRLDKNLNKIAESGGAERRAEEYSHRNG